MNSFDAGSTAEYAMLKEVSSFIESAGLDPRLALQVLTLARDLASEGGGTVESSARALVTAILGTGPRP